MGAGRIALVILGSLVSLVAIGLVFGGGFLLWANGAKTDDEGFFNTEGGKMAGAGYALVVRDLDIATDASGLLATEGFATLKLAARSNAGGKDTFIGIARESDVDAYLNNVDYDEVTRVDISPFRAEYRHHPGTAAPATPASQQFWDVKAQGAGAQPIQWKVKSGVWSILVMNADASRGVDVHVTAGVKVPVIFRLALGLLVGGLALGAVGGLLIYLGLRGTRARPRPGTV